MSPDLSCTAAEHEALLQFLYLAPVGLLQTTRDGRIVMINPLSAQLLMPLAPAGRLTNLFHTLETVAPDLRSQVDAFPGPFGMVFDGLRVPLLPPGSTVRGPQTLAISLLKLDETRLMAVLTDVTEQLRRERLLRQNEAWLNAVLQGIRDYALIPLDASGRIEDWNESIGRVTGFDRAASIGQPFSMLSPADSSSPERDRDLLREADENGWSVEEGWRVRADGSRFWASAMLSPVCRRGPAEAEPRLRRGDESTTADADLGYCLVVRDIDDKRVASEVHRQANFCDHLTGLANRRTFYETAEIELARARRAPRPMSLILFDTDHFKRVNDTHGHAAGDALLRHFAKVCTATFRGIDLVARVGGEEFAVLLPSTGQAAARKIAERLRRAIEEEPVAVEGVDIRYTVSGGIATAEIGDLDVELLMRRADKALYAAKAAGRNRIASFSAA